MTKKSTLYLLILILAVSYGAFFSSPNSGVFAEENVSEDVEDLTDEIKELEEKIADLQGQGKTLQNEIAFYENQIYLTQLRINNAIAEINKRTNLLEELVDDIEDLRLRIEKLSLSIDFQTNVLGERVRARYKSSQSSLVFFIFGSDTLDNLLKKSEYLKVMQKLDKKLLDEMGRTKNAYDTQKNLFEEKKSQTEQIKAEVEAEKANLDSYERSLDVQRGGKQALLNQTQNDEAKYQAELSKARAQLEAIQRIVAGIDFKDGVEVSKGDIIAVMGNSGYPGCSTGAHLHMEVRKDGNVRNPEDYLESKKLYVHDYSSGTKTIGGGNWDWPMKNPTVNQRYGETPWSWRYPSGRHDGIDMEAGDTFIYAPKGGKLVKGTVGCSSTTINFAAIDHGDDLISYYLHIK